MGEILAHALAPPQHLGYRRAGSRHAGAEGELAPDAGVQIEQRLQHRAAWREAGRRIGLGTAVGRRARTVEHELGCLPGGAAGVPGLLRHRFPRRSCRGIGRGWKPHIDGRIGDHLERRVRDIEEQPGHLVAEMVATVASPRHRRGRMHAGAQHLLVRQRPWPQVGQMRAKIDRRLIVVPGHVPYAVDHAAPRIERGSASMPTVRAVGSSAK